MEREFRAIYSAIYQVSKLMLVNKRFLNKPAGHQCTISVCKIRKEVYLF